MSEYFDLAKQLSRAEGRRYMNDYEQEMLARVEQPVWFRATQEMEDERTLCLYCGLLIRRNQLVAEREIIIHDEPVPAFLHQACEPETSETP